MKAEKKMKYERVQKKKDLSNIPRLFVSNHLGLCREKKKQILTFERHHVTESWTTSSQTLSSSFLTLFNRKKRTLLVEQTQTDFLLLKGEHTHLLSS